MKQDPSGKVMTTQIMPNRQVYCSAVGHTPSSLKTRQYHVIYMKQGREQKVRTKELLSGTYCLHLLSESQHSARCRHQRCDHRHCSAQEMDSAWSQVSNLKLGNAWKGLRRERSCGWGKQRDFTSVHNMKNAVLNFGFYRSKAYNLKVAVTLWKDCSPATLWHGRKGWTIFSIQSIAGKLLFWRKFAQRQTVSILFLWGQMSWWQARRLWRKEEAEEKGLKLWKWAKQRKEK